MPMLAAAVAFSALSVGRGAQAQAVAQGVVPERSAVEWLQKIQMAGEKTNFTGTIVMQQGSEVRVSRIAHRYNNGAVRERVQALDGVPHEFVRADNEVRCLWPQARAVVVEWRPLQDHFPVLTDAAPAEVLKSYQFSRERVERVAGQDCQILALAPRDALRYGHRLCVAETSGLLLSAQVLNERNEVLERMAFTDVQVVPTLEASAVEPSWSTQGWRVERTEHEPVDVRAKGWFFWVPEGFKRVREVLRKMSPGGTPQGQAMQSVYSDGLATLSVFIEPDAPSGSGPSMDERIQAHGATHALSRQVGRAAVTVVGEVPASTVRQVVNSVEYRAPH